jgi:hypothetical protein
MRSYLLFPFAFSFWNLSAQEVIIIDKGEMRDYKKKEVRFNENIQAFKFAPLNMLVGEINFAYERQVSQKGSVEVELGPTISKIGFGISNHYVDPFAPSIGENSGMGFVTGIAYRFYPNDDSEALDRFYVSPLLRYKLFNYSMTDHSGFLPDVQCNDSRLDFHFNFGYQTWVAKSFALDMYIGMGIGNRSDKGYSYESYYEGSDWKYRWVENKASGARYVANIGIKVSIGSE